MMRWVYILFFLLAAMPLYGFEVQIGEKFSSKELYNALTDSVPPQHANKGLHFTIKNSERKRQVYLSIVNPTIDKIIINDGVHISELGDLTRFTKRRFKHINHVYPLVLQPNETREIELTVLKQWQSVNFRVVLSTENTFIKTTNHDNFFIGIFYGILFMFLLLLICFYIFSKSNFFLIYLAINFFMLLIFFQYSGTGNQFIWFYSATVQKYITAIAAIGYLTAHLTFVRTFFAMRFHSNFLEFIYKILVFILVLFAVIFFIQLYNRNYGYLHTNIFYFMIVGFFLLYGGTVIGLCIFSYMESRRREILWVMIGMLFHISNWILFINNEFAILRPLNLIDNFRLFPSNIFIPQVNYFITMLEMFIVAIFIAVNYHNLIRQNNLSSQRLEYLQKRNINTFVLGQEAERDKISSEIGTVISNDILHLRASLLKFNAKNEDQKVIPAVLKDIEKTLEDINNITSNYMAPDMQQMKLTELITTATDKLYAEIKTLYNFERIPLSLQLNAVANINLYRILQEISNNILKHAKAKNVIVSAIKDNKSLQIKISDDGVGFSENTSENKGIGLMNIESRINSLNGNFYVLSNEKTGSTVHLIMSLKDIT
jgi:signal transduction histidine kinase